MHHEIKGSGHPLVLIHGFCENSSIWEKVVPLLQDSFQVVSIDLPGFGKSPINPSLASIADVAAQVHDYLVSIGIDRYSIAGHSLGGYVGLELIKQYPECISSLAMVHSTAFADGEEKRRNRVRTIEFVQKRGVDMFIKSFVPQLFSDKKHPDIKRVVDIALTTPQEVLIQYTNLMMERYDNTLTLQKWVKPILFIAGQMDSLVNIEDSRKHLEFIEKNSLIELKSVGHMSMYEATAQLVQELRA